MNQDALRREPGPDATPTKAGASKAAATLADVDLADIQKRMAATLERAKAEDPRELRRRIAELEREKACSRKPTSSEVGKIERVEVPVLKDRDTRRLAAVARILEHRTEKAQAAAAAMQEAAAVVRAVQLELAETLKRLHTDRPRQPERGAGGPVPRPAAAGNPPAPPPHGRRAAAEPGELGRGGLRRMLEALASRPRGLSARQIGETILDPFSGLGTVAMCAIELRRRGLGIELNPAYHADACAYAAAAERKASMPTLLDIVLAENEQDELPASVPDEDNRMLGASQ